MVFGSAAMETRREVLMLMVEGPEGDDVTGL